MVRRGPRGGRVVVPGVDAAVEAYLRAFGVKWRSPQALDDADAVRSWQLAVSAETIWRAIFDAARPADSDRFMRDRESYMITGPDTIEAVTLEN